MGDTGGMLNLYTEIALGCHNLVFQIRLYDPEGADHDTHPTAYTLIPVVKDTPSLFIQIHGAGKTCLNTGRFVTVATLKGKGYMTLLLEYDS
jgi:hypothetical protein